MNRLGDNANTFIFNNNKLYLEGKEWHVCNTENNI